MKFCNYLTNDITNKCDTHIGGVRRIYLINAKDFIYADNTSIHLTVGSNVFEIDEVKNSANLVQNAIDNGRGVIHIESVLTFSLFKDATSHIEQQMDLTLGLFKVLVEYWDRSWLLVDGEPDFFFRMISATRTTGTNEQDLNGTTYQYRLRGLNYGIDYPTMPEIILDDDVNPKWVLINEECETNNDMKNTGYLIKTYQDMNPNSVSYLETKTEKVKDETACPLDTTPDWVLISEECEQV